MFSKRSARAPQPKPVSGDISVYARPFQAFMAYGGRICLAVVLLAVAPAALAQDGDSDTPSHQPVPRWAMLRNDEVYARNGPSKDNPIAWTYHARGLPVQIISETRDWRLICDPDGGVAWVSRTMLQSQKTVLGPAAQKLDMRTGPDTRADIRAILRPRALASLDKCQKDWCKISAGGATGWVPQAALWGTESAAVCRRPDPFAMASK